MRPGHWACKPGEEGQRFSRWGARKGSPGHWEGWKQERGGAIHIYTLPSHHYPSPTPDGNWETKVCPKVKN